MIYWSILSVFVQNRRCIIFIEFELSVIEFSKSHLFLSLSFQRAICFQPATRSKSLFTIPLEIWIVNSKFEFLYFVLFSKSLSVPSSALPLGECSTIQPHILVNSKFEFLYFVLFSKSLSVPSSALPLGECSTIQPHIPSLCKPIFKKNSLLLVLALPIVFFRIIFFRFYSYWIIYFS